MGLLSCMSASKTVESASANLKTNILAAKGDLTDGCTQTEVPETGWLRETLGVSCYSVSTNHTSGLSNEIHSGASTEQSPGKPGIALDPLPPCMSARMLESPTCMPTSRDYAHVEPLLVTSEHGALGESSQTKAELKRVFLEFSQFGTRNESKTMDVYRFTKLCRECDILAQPHDTPSINLIFYKCKGTKTNKLTFGQFKMALKIIAEYLHTDVSVLHTRIIQSEGPLVNGITLPRYVKQHDVHASGLSPTASNQHCITESFLAKKSMMHSMMGGSPRNDATTPRGSDNQGGCQTPTAAVRRTESDGANARSKNTPISAWR